MATILGQETTVSCPLTFYKKFDKMYFPNGFVGTVVSSGTGNRSATLQPTHLGHRYEE